MPEYEPFDWYATPLYYDIIFDAGTATEAAFLEAVHAKWGRSGGKSALEPACGSGRLMAALALRGYRVSGFDTEPAMLGFARERFKQAGVKGDLKPARFDDFGFNRRFDLAFCLVSSFKYVLEEAAAREHLRRIAGHLERGGLYVLGLHLSDYRDRETQVERWRARRGGVSVDCTIKSWPADRVTRTERVRSRIVAKEGGAVRRFESSWDFRTYSLMQLRSLLRSEPRLKHVATYSFEHDITQRIRLGDENLGVVLVLRRV